MINPTHSYKAELIAGHSVNYSVLVETGTYRGEMVQAQLKNFDIIYSIELSDILYMDAVRKFRNHPNVTILHGDSPEVLKELVPLLTGPALFWLDAHFSGGVTAMGNKMCPLLEELDVITGSPYNHGILIDDARCFGVNKTFPTIEEIEEKIGLFTIKNDIIWKI